MTTDAAAGVVRLDRAAGRRRARPWRLAAAFVCLVVGCVYVVPLLWVASVSVRSDTDVFAETILPHSFRLANFGDAWHNFNLGTLFSNTLVVTAGTVVIGIVLSVLAAYGFSRYRSRLNEGLFLLILLGLMIPPAAIIVPFFLMMKNLGLYGTLFSVVLGETAFVLPLGVLILRGYIDHIPSSLIDAARVDGASELRAFLHVAFPLLKPAIATVALFITISTWNGFLLPLVLLRDGSRATLTVGIALASGQYGQLQLALIAAASLLAVVPVLVVFVGARRYYVQGLSAGALKQ